ncbi:hypothetical protein BaRGS_00036345 [Batillaria attramentaria]|uniref:Uncharacterized protein n=1 Tax=Batillaria attramentaria TaxID=370345 RepID=A0ABD0JC48_9CAEN
MPWIPHRSVCQSSPACQELKVYYSTVVKPHCYFLSNARVRLETKPPCSTDREAIFFYASLAFVAGYRLEVRIGGSRQTSNSVLSVKARALRCVNS